MLPQHGEGDGSVDSLGSVLMMLANWVENCLKQECFTGNQFDLLASWQALQVMFLLASSKELANAIPSLLVDPLTCVKKGESWLRARGKPGLMWRWECRVLSQSWDTICVACDKISKNSTFIRGAFVFLIAQITINLFYHHGYSSRWAFETLAICNNVSGPLSYVWFLSWVELLDNNNNVEELQNREEENLRSEPYITDWGAITWQLGRPSSWGFTCPAGPQNLLLKNSSPLLLLLLTIYVSCFSGRFCTMCLFGHDSEIPVQSSVPQFSFSVIHRQLLVGLIFLSSHFTLCNSIAMGAVTPFVSVRESYYKFVTVPQRLFQRGGAVTAEEAICTCKLITSIVKQADVQKQLTTW